MAAKLKLFAIPLILTTTLACAFVQNLIFPPLPTPVPSPSPKLVSTTVVPPTESPTSSPSPSPEPIVNPDPIHCSDDDCLDACLDRLNTVMETRPLAPIGNSIYEEQGARLNLVVYQVNGDKITDPAVLYVPSEYHKYQEDTEAQMRIWNFYVAVIPADLRKLVNEFVIYTDGPEGDSVAWVIPSPTKEDYWQVGFDLLDSDYPPFLADTLVHETAHILTLNSSQLSSDNHYYYYDERKKKFFGCDQYVLAGTCSLPKSYLNLFYQKFWKKSYAEWWEFDQRAQDTKTADEYYEVMEQFYDKHSSWFINDYAATDMEEDIAESFAFFALHPKPSGHSVYEQKIAFFYDFPELVEYRQQMIEGVCSYIRK